MKLKHLSLYLLFGILCIGINHNNCGDNASYLTAPIYTPENEYGVYAIIIKYSGMSGCSNDNIIAVREGGQYFRDARVAINDDRLSVDLDSLSVPFYSSDSISYDDRTEYSLEISLEDENIASGNAIMPTTPAITNIDSGYYHSLNKKLKVKWKPVQYATSIELWTKNYTSGLLKPTTTEHTIPDTVFQEYGDYGMVIIAYNGINPDFELGNYDIELLEKGYNIKGATGIFVIVNAWSGGKRFVIINAPASSRSVKKRENDFSKEVAEIIRGRIIDHFKLGK